MVRRLSFTFINHGASSFTLSLISLYSYKFVNKKQKHMKRSDFVMLDECVDTTKS